MDNKFVLRGVEELVKDFFFILLSAVMQLTSYRRISVMLSGSCRMLSQSLARSPIQFVHLLKPSEGSVSTNSSKGHFWNPWQGYKTMPSLMDFPLTVKPKLSHSIRY